MRFGWLGASLLACACGGQTNLVGEVDAGDAADESPATDDGDPDGLEAGDELAAEAADAPPADGSWDVGPDDPVLEPVGAPTVIDDETVLGGPPIVEWNGDGWGVLWTQPWTQLYFRSLDVAAEPLGSIVALADVPAGLYPDLAWHIDSYLVASAYSGSAVAVALIDASGALRGTVRSFLDDADDVDVGWADSVGGWLLSYYSHSSRGEEIRAAYLDGSGTPVGESHPVGSGWRERGPSSVALKTGAAVTWDREDGVWYRKLGWPDIEAGPAPSLVLPGSLGAGGTTASDAAGYFDTVVIVAEDGTTVWSAAVDNLTAEVVAGPTPIGASDLDDRTPRLRAVESRGYLAACWQVGAGPWGGAGPTGVHVRLLRGDGTPLGAVYEVVRDPRLVRGCNVGWSGEEFIVVYWFAAEGTAENSLLAQRLRPLL